MKREAFRAWRTSFTMEKHFLSTAALSLAASLAAISVEAGQANGSFQVGIKIVARPLAPKVSREVISPASPGYPPHPAAKVQLER